MRKSFLYEVSTDTITTWARGQYGMLKHTGEGNTLRFIPYEQKTDGEAEEMPATDTDGNVVKGKKAYPLRQLAPRLHLPSRGRRTRTNCITW